MSGADIVKRSRGSGAAGSPQGADVTVQTAGFDIGAEIARLTAGRHDIGAVVSFTGLVREIAGEAAGQTMKLEHYPGMTERALQGIVAEARERWPLQGVRVIHRHGRLSPGDAIVLVLVAGRHRQAAFDAAAFLMDYLKTRAPFWKKEGTGDDARWVDARETDDHAAARWRRDG